MDHAVEEDNGDVFVYRGGRAPLHVTHARIDKSVDEIEDNAFNGCRYLLTVDTHDDIRRVGTYAFYNCRSLRQINLKSAIEIGALAFDKCVNLESVEFDGLEKIGRYAFDGCALKCLKLPSIITIEKYAFYNCTRLADVELSGRLETLGACAFWRCERLRRIAIPLKRDLFEFDDFYEKYTIFDECYRLATVDIVGAEGILKTVASLHMESWRTEMIAEINRINQVLPNTLSYEKTEEIRRWMEMVIDKLDHYKAEHNRHVKEGTNLLELALWKAKLGEKEDNSVEGKTKKAKVDAESYRRDKRITCGAGMVIKNVLPFLQLE